MSEPASDPSVAHFGTDGMRRFSVSDVYGTRLPEAVLERLEGSGVPLHVAPYFTAASPSDAIPLAVFAGHHNLPAPSAEMEGGCGSGRTAMPSCACGLMASCRQCSSDMTRRMCSSVLTLPRSLRRLRCLIAGCR